MTEPPTRASASGRNSIRRRELDAFVSHAAADRQIANTLIESLERRGLRVWSDETMELGAPLRNRLAHIENAGAVILLMSSNALRSDWVRREMEHATALLPSRVFVVQLDGANTPPPMRLDTYRWLYLEDPSLVEALVDVLYPSLVEALGPRNSPLPAGIGDIPARVALAGVDGYLEELRAISTGTSWIVGPSGSGKSHLALEFAYVNKGDFDSVSWIDASSFDATNLSHDLQRRQEDLIGAVAPLLILDGLDEGQSPDALLAWANDLHAKAPHCRTIITSRTLSPQADVSAGNVLALTGLSLEESVAFLERSTGFSDTAVGGRFRALAAQSDGLPLLLSLASKLVSNSGLGSLDHILSATPDRAIEALILGSLSAVDRAVLERLALVGEFAEAVGLSNLDLAEVPDLSGLLNSGFLVEDKVGQLSFSHASLVQLLRDQASRDSIRRSIHLVADRLPETHDNSDSRKVLRAVTQFEQYREVDWGPDTKRALSEIVAWMALAWRIEHQPLRALEYAQQASALSEDSGDIQAQVWARNLWSALLFDLERFDEAIELESRSVELASSELGSDHPLTTATKANLSISLRAIGRSHQATSLQREVLRRYLELYGDDHPDTVSSLVNLSASLRSLGEFEEAVNLLESARNPSPDYNSPAQIALLQNLATLYHSLGRSVEARELLQELLNEMPSASQADRLEIQANLAAVVATIGDVRYALRIQESLVTELTTRRGGAHPSTLTAVSNLATFHGINGSTEKAAEMMEELQLKWNDTVGTLHPQTMRARTETAYWYARSGEVEHAVRILETALPDFESVFGPDHPETNRVARQLIELTTE